MHRTCFVNCQTIFIYFCKYVLSLLFGESLWQSEKNLEDQSQREEFTCENWKAGMNVFLAQKSPCWWVCRQCFWHFLWQSCPFSALLWKAYFYDPSGLWVNLSNTSRERRLSRVSSSSTWKAWAELGEGLWIPEESNEQVAEWWRQSGKGKLSNSFQSVGWHTPLPLLQGPICLISSCLLITDSMKCLFGFLLLFFLSFFFFSFLS